RPRPQQFFGLM
uniref:Substance P n=5 Tax=Archosauria TaxID=8492 RepID=TKNA_CHICK|nr:RecName: Full=Substance P [Gallus gallus]AAB24861.1 substance P [Alligator mississippiensis=alligators, brain, Peptide, 11 aa] [Alligator mississippiensis]